METRWVAVDFGGPEVLRQVPVVVLPPKSGEVTIQMRAAGMNPADHKHFGPGQDPGPASPDGGLRSGRGHLGRRP